MVAIPDHLSGLSDDAKAVAGGHFGLMRPHDGTLTFQTPGRITDRAQAALAELVQAGVCTVRTERSGALVYTPAIECRCFMAWLGRNPKAGRFPTVKPEGR